MVAAEIFIMPHERAEALEAYAKHLSAEQRKQIDDAPETAIVRLRINFNAHGTAVDIIEEG